MKKQKLTFQHHLYIVQLGGIILAILISAIVSLSINISSHIEIISDNLLTTVNTLSTSPTVVDSVTREHATDSYKSYMKEFLNDAPLIDSITIFDADGNTIYYTPLSYMADSINEEDKERLLNDKESFIVTKKSPIDNTRYRVAFTYVLGENNEIIGFIAVSILYRRQFSSIGKFIPTYILAMIILLGIGLLFTNTTLRTIRRQLKGYDPEQFAKIYDGNANVLNIIDEGVIAINLDKNVTIINNMGCDILGIPAIPYDRIPIEDLIPESNLPNVLKTEQAIYNEHIVLHGNNLLITHLPLYSNGQLVGAVSLFQNAHRMNEMAEQLEDANSMVDALRAFNHEFMNKLHVILGYLETDHIAEAKEYLLQSSMGSSRSISQIARIITHQGVAAIIIGKSIQASELDITLNLLPESYCKKLTTGISSNIYVTILGNLLQNSIDELNSCDSILKEIQLTVFIDTESTYISVLDTGRGMSKEMVEKVTERNISTKGPGRGTGLYLVNTIVEKLHGSLKIESDPGEGTVVTVMFQKIRNGDFT